MSGEGEDDLAETEAKARIKKLDLEIRKLALDRQLSARQLTAGAVLLEWFKAGSVVVALFGIMVTLWIGQNQLRLTQSSAERQARQAEESRVNERFDKALGHLADRDNVGMRLTGVAALRALMHNDNASHQAEAMQNLITAISHENSLEVRHAILDAFHDLRGVAQGAKDQALLSAVELDRSLTVEFVRDKAATRDAAKRDLYAKFHGHKFDSGKPDFPYKFFEGLDFTQQMEMSQAEYAPIFPELADAGGGEVGTLDEVAGILQALVWAGARNPSKDWTKIYCSRCDFTALRDLSDQHFDGAYLSGTNFSGLRLRHTTFHNADLAQAFFARSDLSGADLSWDAPGTISDESKLNAVRNGDTILPYLECTRLYGANLTNLPMVEITLKFDNTGNAYWQTVRVTPMWQVKWDANLRMDRIGIRTFSSYSASRAPAAVRGGGWYGRTDAPMHEPLSPFSPGDWQDISVGTTVDSWGKLQSLTQNSVTAVENFGTLKSLFVGPGIDALFWKSRPQFAEYVAARGTSRYAYRPPKYDCAHVTRRELIGR